MQKRVKMSFFGVNLYRSTTSEYDSHRELEKEKILSDKVEMQSNEVEHNEKQEPQPPSPHMPPSLPTELSPPVKQPQKLQRKEWHEGISHLRLL
ncbi:hypothetical protein MTR67_000104 [Solanum verrucosum]|uniref:Uncharacterized protein n=1 Tax=Solanum verrucosum TaxID=315347 RepID=A0AAF0PKP0_SOLVR|nr:hypothetical protein MTR67_000104 [Solanum verrucosum]